MAVTRTRSRTFEIAVAAFVLGAVALILAALYALGVISPVQQIGQKDTTSQSGSLRVQGNLHVDRNAAVSGTLDVTGPANLSSVTASGNSTLNSVRLTGPLTSESTLSGTQFISTVSNGHAPLVVNSTTVVPNLHAANSDQLGGNGPGFFIDTSGTTQVKAGGLSVGSLTSGLLVVNGSSNLNGPLAVAGQTSLGGPLSVAGLTTLNGNLAVPGSATVGTLTTAGDATIGGNLATIGSATIGGKTSPSTAPPPSPSWT